MKAAIFTFLSIFLCMVQSSKILENSKHKSCANVTRINVAVNLLDKECLKKSEQSITDKYFRYEEGDSENNLEVTDVRMDLYAVCLLKKASLMNDYGKINLNFDILKIIQHLYKRTDEKGLGLAFVIKSLEKCRNLIGVNEYETAIKIMKCLLENQETILWCNQN